MVETIRKINKAKVLLEALILVEDILESYDGRQEFMHDDDFKEMWDAVRNALKIAGYEKVR